MKIGIVCFNLELQTGGPRLIFELARSWKKAGHTVIIYAPEFHGKYYKELWTGLPIKVIDPPRPLLWKYSSGNLWDRLRQKYDQTRLQGDIARGIAQAMDTDFDMVNYHDFAYKVARHYAARNPQAKTVWTMNDPPFMHLPKANVLYDILSRFYNRYVERVARRDFRSIEKTVVLAEGNKKWANNHGLSADVLWCGIDFEKFYQPVKTFSTPKKSFTILGVGAFNKYRRYDDIVRAAGILRKEGYDARVLLVCKDLYNEAQDKKELLKATNDAGMDGHVDFRFEGASEEELKNCYRKADIFAVVTHIPPPRNGYSWGLAVLEGIAAGLPAIITNTNDLKEALKDNETALFVDPYSPEDIAAKAKFLMDNPADYERIARAGQEFVKEHMDWDTYAKNYLELFH
jgi:glycosyltransferase involved in cell wall biosynthesis